jgi:hypothetical protein
MKKVIVTEINITSGHMLQKGQDTKTNWPTSTSRKSIAGTDNTKKTAHTSKKAALPRASVEITATNFFAPLQTTNMDTDAPGTESNEAEETVPGNLGRQPPIVLTSANNLIQTQKQLKGVAKQIFEFCTTRNGTRVITKNMVDCQISGSPLRDQQPFLLYLLPKIAETHQGSDPPSASKHSCRGHTRWADGLVELGFDVTSIKPTLPLFLITLPRMAKSQDISKLYNLCHVSIKVEAYKSQNALTQCFNCQKLSHIWENYKQPAAACGVGAATCIERGRGKTLLQHQHAATGSWQKEKQHIQQITVAGVM